jgi:hypothetical protein
MIFRYQYEYEVRAIIAIRVNLGSQRHVTAIVCAISRRHLLVSVSRHTTRPRSQSHATSMTSGQVPRIDGERLAHAHSRVPFVFSTKRARKMSFPTPPNALESSNYWQLKSKTPICSANAFLGVGSAMRSCGDQMARGSPVRLHDCVTARAREEGAKGARCLGSNCAAKLVGQARCFVLLLGEILLQDGRCVHASALASCTVSFRAAAEFAASTCSSSHFFRSRVGQLRCFTVSYPVLIHSLPLLQ